MACLKAPQLPRPPGLDLLLPDLELDPSLPNIELCCNFEPPPIPGSPFILPLSSIPNVGVILAPLLEGVTKAIDDVNKLLDELQFSCPLD